MKEIKDYLHLYLGCRVIVEDKLMGTLEGVSTPNAGCSGDNPLIFFDDGEVSTGDFEIETVKPILRPLSDMKKEETLAAFHMSYQDAKYQFDEFQKVDNNDFGWRARNQNGMECFMPANSFKPDVLLYLLKQGFDLFGLIESGLAIDKTKTQNP